MGCALGKQNWALDAAGPRGSIKEESETTARETPTGKYGKPNIGMMLATTDGLGGSGNAEGANRTLDNLT